MGGRSALPALDALLATNRECGRVTGEARIADERAIGLARPALPGRKPQRISE